MRNRSTILLASFITIFVIASSLFVYVKTNNVGQTTKIFLVPVIASLLLWLKVYISRQNLRFQDFLNRYKPRAKTRASLLHIAGACYGTFVGLGILLVSCLFVFDMSPYVKGFMIYYSTVGLILVFLIFWPFYLKKLK